MYTMKKSNKEKENQMLPGMFIPYNSLIYYNLWLIFNRKNEHLKIKIDQKKKSHTSFIGISVAGDIRPKGMGGAGNQQIILPRINKSISAVFYCSLTQFSRVPTRFGRSHFSKIQ